MIELQGIEKTYTSGEVVTQVLTDISFEMSPGEYVAIMGASGTGKSTLMNILGCLDKPTAGHYRLDGTDMVNLDDEGLSHLRNHKIGFVFQQFHLLQRTTALKNVLLPLMYSDHYPEDAEEWGENALAMVGLSDRLHYRPNQLSGGQQQRVAIARALIRVVTKNAALMADQAQPITRLLRERHRIRPPLEDDFRINTPTAIAKIVRGTSGTLSILLVALASLSLLVGGVVLMNILLISVAERTKEIGLRRAVGATRRDIRNQFLLESAMLAGMGGILGVAIGLSGAWTVSALGYWDALVSWPSAAVGFLFSVSLGVAFGLYPAMRAAALEPIDALRSE